MHGCNLLQASGVLGKKIMHVYNPPCKDYMRFTRNEDCLLFRKCLVLFQIKAIGTPDLSLKEEQSLVLKAIYDGKDM